MKRRAVWYLVPVTSALLCLGCPSSMDGPQPSAETAIGGKEVKRVVGLVNGALMSAQNELSGQGLKVTKATVTLKLVRSRSTEGSGGLLVFSGKTSRAVGDSTALTITFDEPDQEDEEVSGDEALQSLRTAIVLAAEAAKEATNLGIGSLTFDSVAATVGFTLKDSASGGLAVEIVGFEVGLATSTSSTTEHTIALTFESI